MKHNISHDCKEAKVDVLLFQITGFHNILQLAIIGLKYFPHGRDIRCLHTGPQLGYGGESFTIARDFCNGSNSKEHTEDVDKGWMWILYRVVNTDCRVTGFACDWNDAWKTGNLCSRSDFVTDDRYKLSLDVSSAFHTFILIYCRKVAGFQGWAKKSGHFTNHENNANDK